MLPDLVKIGGGALHTYGVLIAVGFAVGIVLAIRQARREGQNADAVLDLAFWLLVAGFVGARALFILTDLGHYAAECRGDGTPRGAGRLLWDCTKALHLWEGGLVWYGGFLLALGVGAWFLRRRRLSFLRVADIVIPSVPLGHFFGRLGCFAAGCCYGKPLVSRLGVTFGPSSHAFQDLWGSGVLAPGAVTTPALHPTQLYEALGELVIFIGLLWLRRRKRHDGQLLFAYLFAYPLLRSLVEIARGDAARGFVFELHTAGLNAALGLPLNAPSFLSVSQFISLVVAAVALATLLLLGRRRTRLQ